MNWALSYQLNIQPIFRLHATDIHELIINHTPIETAWKLEPIKTVVQLMTNIVGALIRGDYKTFAVNTAFFASSSGMFVHEDYDQRYKFGGKLISAPFLSRFGGKLISAPFLSRLPVTGFVGFDLYEQVKAYRNGNKEAMVNMYY
uniref:Uncharacterized protein n=1 Tax=Romanomermis culicivorax TaxID=13658 RepID=A0A915J4B7_ROMCU